MALSADGSTALVAGGVYNAVATADVYTAASGWSNTPDAVFSHPIDSGIQPAVALSADGQTALFGAPGSGPLIGPPGGQQNSDAAYLYIATGRIWPTVPNVTIPDPQPEGFGGSVALSADGRTVLIGAIGYQNTYGAAHVYTISGTDSGWSFSAAATYFGNRAGESFGRAVALSRDGATALIGGPDDGNGMTGSAYLVTASSGVWPTAPQVIFTYRSDGNYSGMGMGYSVALSGDGKTAFVGAPGFNSNSGVAYLYTAAPSWSTTPVQTFPNQLQPSFGSSVALSTDGQVALIGARGNTGAAYVYATPAPTAPASPTAVTAQTGNGAATVSWSPPADDGGSPITSYTVAASDATNPATGGQTVTGAAGPLTVTGLTGGDAYTFTVTATNAAGISSVPSAPSNVVIVQQAPAITSAASASTGMRTPFSFAVQTTATPTAVITEFGALPRGITLTDNGNGTATLAGTAPAGSAGSYHFTFSATNGVGGPATQSFALTVTSATSAPAIISDSADTETFSVPYTFTVTTTGYPAPKLTKSGALPAGVSLTDNGDGTAILSGTPAKSALGVYPITLTAKSSAGTATQPFSLTVTKAPVIKKIPITTAHVGISLTIPITVSGYTTPAVTESGILPAGLAFTDNHNGTATIAGTPAVGTGGAYPITITGTNLLGTASQSFTLRVNEAPAITSPATANAPRGSAFSFMVTATGYPVPKITEAGPLPAGISFKASTATFSGTPKANATGTYRVIVTAANSTTMVTQLFTVTVS